MSKLDMKDISDAMKHVDICMMTTNNGTLESRPMSNNRDVDYDGDSYFFANGSEEVVRDIENKPDVNLAYIHQPTLGKPIYISVKGKAEAVTDRGEMKKHWVPDLEAWFKDGIDTPGLTMIHVKAASVKYWSGGDTGEIAVS
ncbi:MAG: pyridoxamine 5'-phosphate oxidase family protein [Alphaproteobacteria bacterium]|nr:pyridoxamine 5'-phosphate oxidase family protein [Alphaproteobacteria bacterium]MBV9419775.1 pyridoxamine 5'-phosphate oxidase family protein [Alphaproteobacteria bacterium]MBV9540352.1 pyridoxamine 5'-phosphate oxidase family protein [Alphaproteobacteria bacterium]MBV9903175.1 pyridoxamine 5'-phosphate oxidase family protein [Alphaproteobacteria bacterium]